MVYRASAILKAPSLTIDSHFTCLLQTPTLSFPLLALSGPSNNKHPSIVRFVFELHSFFDCSFISLLEYAEEHLDCTYVIFGLLKDRQDRGNANGPNCCAKHEVKMVGIYVVFT